MSHFWQRLLGEKESSLCILKLEIKSLQKYAHDCMEKNKMKDAMQALSSAIELRHFILKKWKFSTRKRNKLMRENLSDLREYMKLEMLNSEVEAPKKKIERPMIDFGSITTPVENLSEELQDIYKKFASCVKFPERNNSAWDSIVGNEEAKDIILRSLEYPILLKSVRPSNRSASGVLLYGPPGTGKSMIARAVVHKVKMNFLELQVKDIMSKYQGESENNVAEFFTLAHALKPCVIFVDEIDSLLGKRSTDSESPEARRGVTNQLLLATQGCSGLFLIGATNTPWQIDSAFLRRFDYKCYIKLPDFKERKQMLINFLKQYSHSLLSADIDLFAKAMDGYSGSDMASFLLRVEDRQGLKLDQAQHFVKDIDGVWFMCNKLYPNAVKKSFRQLYASNEKFRLPNLSVVDFDLAEIEKASKSVEIEKYNQFKKTFL